MSKRLTQLEHTIRNLEGKIAEHQREIAALELARQHLVEQLEEQNQKRKPATSTT
jgi:uncharacterized coiled-coil protein SlyX